MKKTENGRSMIEMLGVLAIIGVLSVGGIAGYSKAMTKYRVNKTIDQVSMIMANTRTLFGTQKNYAALTTSEGAMNENLVLKTKLFPEELLDSDGVAAGSNAFGGDITIMAAGRSSEDDTKAFIITLSGVTESACMELATQDWGSSSGSGLIAFGVNGPSTFNSGFLLGNCTSAANAAVAEKKDKDGKITQEAAPAGYVQCGGSGPMSVTNATSACAEGTSTLTWKFY